MSGRNDEFNFGALPVRTLAHPHDDELYDHLTGPDHPEISEPSDLEPDYLRSLHDDCHANDDAPLEREAGGQPFVVPRGYYGEQTHTHAPETR